MCLYTGSCVIRTGGVREAFFSDNYEIVWGNRVGFARVAVESQVVSPANFRGK